MNDTVQRLQIDYQKKLPRRSNPTCRSDRFDRIRVGFHRKPTSFIKNRSDPTDFLSEPIGRNPTKTLSDPIEIIQIRQHPIPP
jgi:hypothetical protein